MKGNLTKSDLAVFVYKTIGFSKKEASHYVDLIFNMIKERLSKGQEVKLSGFGKFILLDKKSRVGRNPQTGEKIKISPRRVLSFKPSKLLKEYLNS